MRPYTGCFEFNEKDVFYKPHWCWWKKSKVINIRKKEEQVTLLVLLLLFSHSLVSDSLQPQGLQHARLAHPSLSSRVSSNSCPLSRWCHPTISSFATLFPSCPQSFPASESFLISQLFASGGQSSEGSASASASILPMNIQGRFPLGLTGLSSLPFKGLSRVFSSTTIQKHQFFSTQPSLWSNAYILTWLMTLLLGITQFTTQGRGGTCTGAVSWLVSSLFYLPPLAILCPKQNKTKNLKAEKKS